MLKGRAFLDRFVRDGSGTTSIEYAVIALLLAIAVVGAVAALGRGLVPFYERTAEGVAAAGAEAA